MKLRGHGPPIFCSKRGGPIVGIDKSLTETWMWKLGTRPCSFISGNICFEFSAQCLRNGQEYCIVNTCRGDSNEEEECRLYQCALGHRVAVQDWSSCNIRFFKCKSKQQKKQLQNTKWPVWCEEKRWSLVDFRECMEKMQIARGGAISWAAGSSLDGKKLHDAVISWSRASYIGSSRLNESGDGKWSRGDVISGEWVVVSWSCNKVIEEKDDKMSFGAVICRSSERKLHALWPRGAAISWSNGRKMVNG